MKPNLKLLLGTLLCACALVLIGGCVSANRASYAAVGTERVTVQTALGLWNQYVGQNHPGTNAEYKVKAAYEKWQSAQFAVCDAGAVLAAASQTNSSSAAAFSAALDQAITNLSQEKADMLNLLQGLGVKLPGL